MEDLKPGFYFASHKSGIDPVLRLVIINSGYTGEKFHTYAIVVNTRTCLFSKCETPETLNSALRNWDITPL